MSFSTVYSETLRPSPTLHTMRPENVFQGQSIDDVRRHICLLTVALARYQDGQPTPSSLLDNDPELRKRFTLLRHVSTLLTIGTDSDKNAASVNFAVTGSIETDRIVSIIATQNAPAVLEPTSDAVIVKLEIGNSQGGVLSGLLERWWESSGKTTFDQHLRDITAILSHILQLPAPDRFPLEGPLTYWVTRRAFMTLSARLENAKAIWGRLPAQLMQMWSDAHDDPDQGYTVSFRDAASSPFAMRLARHGIQPDDSVGSASSSSHSRFSGSAKAWLSVIAAFLDKLQRILIPKGVRTAVELEKQQTIDVSVALSFLDRILTSTLLEELTRSTFNQKLQDCYNECQKARREKWIKGVHRAGHLADQEHSQSGEVGAELHNEDALDDSDSDSSNQEPAENAVTHLWRYLQTLTAWHSAARAFCRLRIPSQPLVVYQLKSRPSLPINQEHIQQFVEDYLTAVEDYFGGREGTAYKNANALLKKAFYQKDGRQLNPVFKIPPLHAEAALMALACSRLHPSEAPQVNSLENVDTIFTSAQVVIGVSKKCCRCCSLFAQHMANNSQEGQELQFVLPGTHSIIYPWLPPAFGVPDHVLVSMRGVLFATFHRVAVEHITGLTSTQSSPTSSLGEPGIPGPEELAESVDWDPSNEDED
ncbi:hypothetical protein BV20DRAFT_1119829 [Pilatotrama ljubarskyi]|nr:hypothetical protein BV20DRAFT_1119829 [Pilatotrama ljubarskyi]